MDFTERRLVVVSNRLPVALNETSDGAWEVKPGTGGLVTALQPIIKRSKGVWIGWPGCDDSVPFENILRDHNTESEFNLIPIPVSSEEVHKYYRGFANRAIWPLFHDLLEQFFFDLEEYGVYLRVNRRFAEITAQHIQDEDIVWIHDYQLICVGHYLREAGVTGQLNFFLHIPFPSLDLYRRFPRNRELLQAILRYDHIGFQTADDRRNFINCVKWLLPEAQRITRKRQAVINYQGHVTKVGFYPISIDFNDFNQDALSQEVAEAAWYLRENVKVKKMILGLDRLDYTKGIPERFLAIERLLEKYPETRRNVSLLQIVIPSRLNVPDYQELKKRLDFLVGRINSRFSEHGWVPILYQFRTLHRHQLLGHYKAADIALITPLRDGMNLVSKEFCAASTDDLGVLILSEFTGAAAQMAKGAMMVNPFDIDGTADAIFAAYNMPEDEQRRRMKLLRAEVKRHDVMRWVNWFLGDKGTQQFIGDRFSDYR